MKLAACFSQKSVDCKAAVEDMTRSMQLSEDQDIGCFPVPGGAIGYVCGNDRYSSVPFMRKSENGNILLITGVPIVLYDSIEKKLDEILEGPCGDAEILLQSLDGAFAALFWDAAEKKLLTVTDCLGLQPLYMSSQDHFLLLATDLKAFPASGLVDVKTDTAGWGAFISMGFTIGAHTQLESVRRVDCATSMVYDSTEGRLQSDSYWSMPEPKPDMTIADVDIAQMLEIIKQEIQGYTSHCSFGTLLLSGGFDSRLILTLLKRLKIDCNALILTHPEHIFGTDGKIAVKIAKNLKCNNVQRAFPSKGYYSSSSYLKYLVINEVMIPSMVLYMSPHVFDHIQPEMKAVWEGLGPGFVFAPSYPVPGGFASYKKDRCLNLDSLQWQAALSIFSTETGQGMYENYKDLLNAEIAKYPDDDFGTARFQMANQMRNYLAPSPLTVYASKVLPFTPGLSKELWNLAGSIPLSVMANMKLYKKVFKDYLPEAFSVPVCSGAKLISSKKYAPELWARRRFNALGHKAKYYWQRLPRLPVVGSLIEKSGIIPPQEREENPLFDAVVRAISPDHPELNADTVKMLQAALPPYSWSARLGRRFLFYWQVWQWVMQGKLTTGNADSFLDGKLWQHTEMK